MEKEELNGDIILNENCLRILRDIRILNITYGITRKQLCSKLGISHVHPHIYSVLKFCVQNNMIKKESVHNIIKVYHIDNNKLEKFIRNYSEEFRKWGKFIEATTSLYNY